MFLQKQSRRHLQDETVLGAAELTPVHVSNTPEDKSEEMTFFPKYCHHLAYMYFNKTPLSKPPAKYRTVLIMILLRYLKISANSIYRYTEALRKGSVTLLLSRDRPTGSLGLKRPSQQL